MSRRDCEGQALPNEGPAWRPSGIAAESDSRGRPAGAAPAEAVWLPEQIPPRRRSAPPSVPGDAPERSRCRISARRKPSTSAPEQTWKPLVKLLANDARIVLSTIPDMMKEMQYKNYDFDTMPMGFFLNSIGLMMLASALQHTLKSLSTMSEKEVNRLLNDRSQEGGIVYFNALEKLGISVKEGTDGVISLTDIGKNEITKTTDELVKAISEAYGVDPTTASAMIADFKNYSADFAKEVEAADITKSFDKKAFANSLRAKSAGKTHSISRIQKK